MSDDHARGCQGREYTCTCGYDERMEKRLAAMTPKTSSNHWEAFLEGAPYDPGANSTADMEPRITRGEMVRWLQSVRGAAGEARKVAWLIERKGLGDDPRPHWYVENEDDGWHWWTPVAYDAKRFGSEHEAKAFHPYQMIASDLDISVTEHVFLSPAADPEMIDAIIAHLKAH